MKLPGWLLQNWNLSRVLFLVLGTVIVISSAASSMTAGILVGAYYALIGLLGVGCAAGNCSIPPGKPNEETHRK